MAINIAIFASGSGTNAENIIRYFDENSLVNISLVLSNKSDAYVLERVRKWLIPTFVFTREELNGTDKVLSVLKENNVDFIVLAGFLLRVPDAILKEYPFKIINIHPALLPNYGGKGMYGDRVHEAVIAAGEKETGITIHYINECYDEGDIIFQVSCLVDDTDTLADVAEKVHALEYKYYPKIIEEVLLLQNLLS